MRTWTIVAASTAMLVGLVVLAQDNPAFDVASVKASHGEPVKAESDPGRLTITSESLEVMIELAYGLREYQYEGPAWLHTTRYDIVATTSTPQSRAAQLVMLREVLADRFKLKTHQEPRNMPVYALVAGKNGPKLKPLDVNVPATSFDLYYNISMVPVPGGATEFRAVGTLGLLCDFLSRIAGRPVVDRTGISGAFDLRLLCAIEGFPGYETSPTVFEALQSQMGLKLEPRTEPVDVTVVDHVEKPTVN
jgi:uncharacterized protein (TIGR03435 family)